MWLSWKLNELMYIKHLEQCLAFSKPAKGSLLIKLKQLKKEDRLDGDPVG